MSLFSLIKRSLRDDLTEVSSYMGSYKGTGMGGSGWTMWAQWRILPRKVLYLDVFNTQTSKTWTQQTWTKVVLLWSGAWASDFQNFMPSNLLGCPASVAAQLDHSSSLILCPAHRLTGTHRDGSKASRVSERKISTDRSRFPSLLEKMAATFCINSLPKLAYTEVKAIPFLLRHLSEQLQVIWACNICVCVSLEEKAGEWLAIRGTAALALVGRYHIASLLSPI